MQTVGFTSDHDYTLHIWHDTRRAKKNGKFPVKLQVYSSLEGLQKNYRTPFDLSKDDFDRSWVRSNPKGSYFDVNQALQAIIQKAQEAASKVSPFTIQEFDKAFNNRRTGISHLGVMYDNAIQRLLANNQLGTSDMYSLSRKSIGSYIEDKYCESIENFPLHRVDKSFLDGYERYMVSAKDRSKTTVSMYVRVLRTLYKRAIDNGFIEKERYPFGKGRYQVPRSRAVKKALTRGQLGSLIKNQPIDYHQERAKDYWLLSYYCYGINMKDLLSLKNKDFDGTTISYHRSKTRYTDRSSSTAVRIRVTKKAASLIRKLSSSSSDPDEFLLPILKRGDDQEQSHKKIKNFIRYVNQHMKRFCSDNDLPDGVTTMWARHTFARNLLSESGDLVMVQQCLGHSNITTTQNYLRSLDESHVSDVIKKLFDS